MTEKTENDCPCGRDTCTESWEPGCGLGTEEKYAVVVPETNPCQCIDCGGTEHVHSPDCTYMKEVHGDDKE